MSEPRDGARLDPLSRPVALTATGLVAGLALAAFAMGVPGLVHVAEWAGLRGPLRFLVPAVLDAGLVVSALAVVVARARREPAALARGTLVGLTTVSVAAQVAHVTLPAYGRLTPVDVAGACLAATAPLTVLLATEILLSLAIAPPRRVRRRTTTPKPAPAPKSAARTGTTPPAATGTAITNGAAKPTEVKVPSDREAARAEVLRLRAEGLPYSTVAARAGVPVSTAKRWAQQAQQAQEVAS